MTRESEHTCHAQGCDTHVPPRMFMCRPHWFALPKAMRDDLWAAYVPGQERRMDPSAEYLEVARRCINHIAEREGRQQELALDDAAGITGGE
jgi:hypothetical protein